MRLINNYLLKSEKYSDLCIEFIYNNSTGCEIIFNNEQGVMKCPYEKFIELNLCIRDISKGILPVRTITFDNGYMILETINNSASFFSLKIYFDDIEEFKRYDIDYLSFVGDNEISSDVCGFLEDSTSIQIKKIQKTISESPELMISSRIS